MKEKVSLKRVSRRCKSESEKAKDHAHDNHNPCTLLLKDGKPICPIPLIECVCPGVPVDEHDSTKAVKMVCSNHHCPHAGKAVHMDCFHALEDKMYILLKHSGHKTSSWTESQLRNNLWDKRGLTLVQTMLRCPCNGGISTRDDDAWALLEKEAVKTEKKKKSKKSDLPPLIVRARNESETIQDFDSPHYDPPKTPAFSQKIQIAPTPRSSASKWNRSIGNVNINSNSSIEFPNLPVGPRENSRRTISHCDAAVNTWNKCQDGLSYKDVAATPNSNVTFNPHPRRRFTSLLEVDSDDDYDTAHDNSWYMISSDDEEW